MQDESTENHSILNQSTMILNPVVGALITENVIKERGECVQRSRGIYPSPSAQTWSLKSHVELQPLSVCVWTVGEQVGIVSVKQREIDGVG